MSEFDEPPSFASSSYDYHRHHTKNDFDFVRRPKPIGRTRRVVSESTPATRATVNYSESDSHKENNHQWNARDQFYRSNNTSNSNNSSQRRTRGNKGRDQPPPPPAPPSSSPELQLQSHHSGLTPPKLFKSEWEKFSSKQRSSSTISSSSGTNAASEWTQEPTLAFQTSPTTATKSTTTRRGYRKGFHSTTSDTTATKTKTNASSTAIERRKARMGTHVAPLERISPRKLSSCEPTRVGAHDAVVHTNFSSLSAVPTRIASTTASNRNRNIHHSDMDQSMDRSFASAPAMNYSTTNALVGARKLYSPSASMPTRKSCTGPVDVDEIDDVSSEEEQQQSQQYSGVFSTHSRRTGPVDVDEIDNENSSSSSSNSENTNDNYDDYDRESIQASRSSRLSHRIDLDDGAVLDTTNTAPTPTKNNYNNTRSQQQQQRNNNVLVNLDPSRSRIPHHLPPPVVTPPTSPTRASCNVSPLTIGGKDGDDDFTPQLLVVANGTKRRGAGNTTTSSTNHAKTQITTTATTREMAGRRNHHDNTNASTTGSRRSSFSTTSDNGTDNRNNNHKQVAAAAAAIVSSTLQRGTSGNGSHQTTEPQKKAYRKHPHFTFLDNASQLDLPTHMLDADASSVISSNVSSVSGTTASYACDISHSSAGTTSVYPVKEESYLHAQRAGTLWQSIVGQHVKFPESWWGESRKPSMGVNDIDAPPNNHYSNKNGGSGDVLVEKIPEHPWRYIALDPFCRNDILDDFVPTKRSSGRLILHIVITDSSTWRPVQDVAIGCYHPFHRDLCAEKGRNIRALWMALRRRSGYVLGCTALVDPFLMSECNICDIEMASPLGRRRRLRNNHLRAVFGDMPPEETIVISETDLVAKINNARSLETFDVRTDIKLLLLEMFLRRTVEI